MNKLVIFSLLGFCAWQVPAMSYAVTATSEAVEGKLLFSEDGHRLGAVYKVETAGAVELIFNHKLVTIPADTLSDVQGKLTTTLTKREVYDLTQPAASG